MLRFTRRVDSVYSGVFVSLEMLWNSSDPSLLVPLLEALSQRGLETLYQRMSGACSIESLNEGFESTDG